MVRRLVVIAGPSTGSAFDLDDGTTLSIGRGMDSDTKINDARMSRIHCRVIVEGDSVKVVDAGSSTGTFLSGVRVEESELVSGSVIAAGDTQLRYEIAGATVAEANNATIMDGIGPAGADAGSAKHPSLVDLVGSMIHHYRIEGGISRGRKSRECGST